MTKEIEAEAVAAGSATGLDNWTLARRSLALAAGSGFGSLVEVRFWVGSPTGPGRLAAVGPAGQSRGAGADLETAGEIEQGSLR